MNSSDLFTWLLLTITGLSLAAGPLSPVMAVEETDSDWHQGLPRQHHSEWLVHDLNRPKPPTVTPGNTDREPPADALVLFDGSNMDLWQSVSGGPASWRLVDGYMEVNDTGNIRTRASFADCQLHLEYRAPTPPQQSGQHRANSGIIFMGRYEVQVLDNFDNPTYADGYIGAVYGQQPPLVNAGRKPGQWQSFDIIFRAPRFEDGALLEPGRLTVFVNGVLVQFNSEIYGEAVWRQAAHYSPHADTGPLVLQDHGDKQAVAFRNIWIRPLMLP